MKHFLVYLPILLLTVVSSCKKSGSDDEGGRGENNDLPANNFSINGAKYAANATGYFDLNNEISSCYQLNPDGYGGFGTNYCVHIFFSGKKLPTQDGTYDIVFFNNLTAM